MIHRIRQFAIIIGALLATLCADEVQAAPPEYSPGFSSVNTQDFLYDYEVWIAWDIVKYYVVAKFADGHTEEFSFSSEQNAQDFIAWLAFHIDDFAGAHVEERLEVGPWTYLATYDTRAQAESVAAYAISLDYYAAVVPVSDFATTLSP